MKTTITTLVLFFFTFQLTYAQYIPFPETSAKWSLELTSGDNGGIFLGYNETKGFSQEIDGDTIVNGLTYQKVYTQRTWWLRENFNGTPYSYFTSGNIEASRNLFGGIRQDTLSQKVYFQYFPNSGSGNFIGCIDTYSLPENQDIVLYDFNAEVGDTIYLHNNEFIIHNVDIIQLNDGIDRRRFDIYSANGGGYGYNQFIPKLIEGVGSDAGLFGGIQDYGFVEGNLCKLNCFAIEENYLIGNGFYQCDSIDVMTSSEELLNNLSFDLHPNPFNETLQLGFESSQNRALQFTITNNVGQVIFEKEISANDNEILSTQNWATGIYFVTIKDDDNNFFSKKITKSF